MDSLLWQTAKESRFMSEPTPTDCRSGAISILRKLREAGHETYFAGGCVRDRLLSGSPIEYDHAID